MTIAFFACVAASVTALAVGFLLGGRRVQWASTALQGAERLIVEANLRPGQELPAELRLGLLSTVTRLHRRLEALWWSRFVSASVLVAALLAGAAGSSLGGRPVVAFVLGAILGGLFMGAVSGTYAGRGGKQGTWMAEALTSAVRGNVKASAELPFAMSSLLNGGVDQQFGGFVRVARAYADQAEP